MAPTGRETLFTEAIVIDATAPLAPYTTIESTYAAEDLTAAYAGAGVTLVVFTVVDDYPNSIEQTIRLIGANRQFVHERPDRYVLAHTASDIRRAKQQGKLAVAFAFQGTNALMGDIALVEVYRRLGVIQMLLAYNSANLAADGCHETRNAGLTDYGKRLIAEMNRVGMLVDLSHVGLRSAMEALELTSRPPIFSHSTPKRFAPHDRNITDEQIRACAAKDGVVCLSGVGIFLDGKEGRVTPRKLADSIDYVAQLVGPRHAGIGLDFVMDPEAMARYVRANASTYGGGAQYPQDGRMEFASPAMIRDVADLLSERGYPDEDVRGILGKNYLRVLEVNAAGRTGVP
jgi:membrane dipeptidase